MSKRGGHHGGAWKVAYADFVTAMMALFMVLWLAAQDQKIKEAIERAFRHPFMSLTKDSAGLMPTKNENAPTLRKGNLDETSSAASQFALLRRLKKEMAKPFESKNNQDIDESVQFLLTPEGLRINIFDRSRKPIFQKDSPELTVFGRWVLSTIAWQISRYDTFQLELEGHTEQGMLVNRDSYGTWELSTDRANTGRRSLVAHGVSEAQIRKIAGFADTQPLPDTDPRDSINRRLSMLLRVTIQSD